MPTLMVQGTTSDAGKSTLVTALCRWARRQGVSVAPFKPQNMALNSAVTADGGEIGRAQAVQAQAAGLAPHTDMNPVLLKPNSDMGAQVIIHGRAIGNMQALTYHGYKPVAMAAVLESHARLVERHQLVLVEGAGSPAEINLRAGDIANMGFAEAVDCPVILIADIDKGGVFAHLVGTLELLSPSEQARIRGFVINRFRGDIALLKPGLDWLEQRTGKPVLGVLPYLTDFHLEAEDAVDTRQQAKSAQALRVVVPVLPGGIGCLAGVLIFGPVWGFVYNYVGICIGSLAAFAVARNCGKPLLTMLFSEKTIAKYSRWAEERNRFARLFALAIFLPVAPDDFLCYLAGTTEMSWRQYTAIILLGKPFAIALYSLGLTVVWQHLVTLLQ